ncbi:MULTISPECIES: lantibiotic dehydratase [unclassified Frankia]|uniref:lantibiotic dehydratase n=1 Tax=unclassified Frankia TaxID=2632575 RepID=UPI0012FF7748|nr:MULTISPECIES: lantibiotic dehydratase [unclassified Frankia]
MRLRGYPVGYRGSVLPTPPPGISERDERLLVLTWQAMADGTREIILTDDVIGELTGETFDDRYIPPHVELSARIHAATTQALDRGDFLLTVAPARSAGTLTSRFTPTATGSGLARAYRALPAATAGALRVQMSFGPLYPHAENVCRVPAYLDHVLPLGEHRQPGDDSLLTMDDLAITATRDRLHLVSISRRQVVEPQVFHALARDKQPPPLARFLAHLPGRSPPPGTSSIGDRASGCRSCHGCATGAPSCPRPRGGLPPDDLPPGQAGPGQWRQVLDRWRRRWDCAGTALTWSSSATRTARCASPSTSPPTPPSCTPTSNGTARRSCTRPPRRPTTGGSTATPTKSRCPRSPSAPLHPARCTASYPS